MAPDKERTETGAPGDNGASAFSSSAQNQTSSALQSTETPKSSGDHILTPSIPYTSQQKHAEEADLDNASIEREACDINRLDAIIPPRSRTRARNPSQPREILAISEYNDSALSGTEKKQQQLKGVDDTKTKDGSAPGEGANSSSPLTDRSSTPTSMNVVTPRWRVSSSFPRCQTPNSTKSRTGYITPEYLYPQLSPVPQAAYVLPMSRRPTRAMEPPGRYEPYITTAELRSDVVEDTATGRSGMLGAAPDVTSGQSGLEVPQSTSTYVMMDDTSIFDSIDLANRSGPLPEPDWLWPMIPENNPTETARSVEASQTLAHLWDISPETDWFRPIIRENNPMETASSVEASQTTKPQTSPAPSDSAKVQDREIAGEDLQISRKREASPEQKKRGRMSGFKIRKLLKRDRSENPPS